MKKRLANAYARGAILRILADFIVVQVCAVLALVPTTALRAAADGGIRASVLLGLVGEYYLRVFLPLSFVFPSVYALYGFYTRSRTYSKKYKWRTISLGTMNATLLYLFLSFLVTRAEMFPRSGIVAFAVLVAAATIGIRWLKSAILDTEPRPKLIRTVNESPVLVVGGGGYIGSLLVRKLLDTGQKVRVLDRLIYGAEPIRDVLDHPNLELMVGDCRNIQNVVAAVRGVQSIVHLAAIVGDPACEQDRQTALETNYAATRMLIEVAKGFQVRSLVFASSCSVYGASEQIVNERSALKPISLYAQTKVDSEHALLEAKSESFHPVILRFATVFGYSHRPRFDLAVNLLTARAHKEGIITIYNGEQWRPFIHARDVVEAIITALKAPATLVSGEIFNVGDSRLNYTLEQVAASIREQFPNLRVEYVDNADRRNYRVCFDKIKNHLGFQARVSLEEGIAEIRAALERKDIWDYTDVAYHNQRFLEAAGPQVPKDATDSCVMAAFARAMGSYNCASQPVSPRDSIHLSTELAR